MTMLVSSMNGWKFFFMALVLGFGSVVLPATYAATREKAKPAIHKIEDPCEYAEQDMVLKRVWKDKDLFYGEFEIRIAEILEHPIDIGGTREKDGFYAYSSTSYEFKDASGQWRWYPDAPGTYLGTSDHLYVTHEQRAKIIAPLPPADLGETATAWRLVLRSWENKQCMKSLPFRVKQQRGPVEGYVSDPEPKWWNAEKKDDKKCPADKK